MAERYGAGLIFSKCVPGKGLRRGNKMIGFVNGLNAHAERETASAHSPFAQGVFEHFAESSRGFEPFQRLKMAQPGFSQESHFHS